ncbi:hypothetical protein PG997_000194 [Apiospora hydei]|uniref:Uncharacterized protein n=1 Tax=Apiospora hydei TaxID=1337664 RepID=A0ABR1XA54_9PEZI
MHNLEVPQEMALRSLGFRVVIARGLQEAPREVDLLTQFASGQQQSQQNNARLGDWVLWGILQRDPAKFRFVVHPITEPANSAAAAQEQQ